MYYMFLGDMQIPIPPPSMVTGIKNQNKTISLLGSGEVNILKDAGLTDIAFSILLPNVDYPFNDSFLMRNEKAPYYLDKIEQLKIKKEPFQFIVVRMKDGGEMINISNIKVSMESYTIRESAKDGYDFIVDIKLKKYKSFGAKKLVLKTDSEGKTTGTIIQTRISQREIPTEAQAVSGYTLAQNMKRILGNTNGVFSIAKLNKIAVPIALTAEQIIRFKE